MSQVRVRTLIINHAAELSGGELALFDFVTSDIAAAIGPRVLLLSHGPLLDHLESAGVPTNILNAGGVLEIRRSDGVNALLRAPALIRLVLAITRRFAFADIVYANSQKAFVAAALATLIRHRPLVWHLHDILDAQHFGGLMRRIAINLGNRRATLVIANSAATRDAYRAAGGTVPVAVVHNGIDPAPFAVANTKRAGLRTVLAQRVGSGEAALLGLFGRLVPWKGQHVAIRALADLPNCHLVLVGAALFGEEPYEKRLRALSIELGVADRVHFLGFCADVASLMASVDIAIHCSVAPEPFGRVIVEAMMATTPVIATDAGGAREIVEDHSSGRLVQPDDAAALGAAVRVLLADPRAARSLAEAGRVRASTLFSLDAINTRLTSIISSIAS